MVEEKNDSEYPAGEEARRRDAALQRALSMPPKPHKRESIDGGGESAQRPRGLKES
jgi:hypothetical protein